MQPLTPVDRGPAVPVPCRHRGLVVFWGDAVAFTDWILRIAEAEAAAMDVIRVEDLADLPPATAHRRHILVADDMARELLDDPNRFACAQPCTRWILAYRDEAVALRLLAQRRECNTVAAVGLLPMNLPVDQWTPMFRLALGGDCVVPARLLDLQPPPRDAAPSNPNGPPLTPREREVLARVAQGKRNKTIARELDLTEHTIKLHLHNVLKKLGVQNRTEATQWLLSRQGGAAR